MSMTLDPLRFNPTTLLCPDDPLAEELHQFATDPNSDLQGLLDAAETYPGEVLSNPALLLEVVANPTAFTDPAFNQAAGAAALAEHEDLPDIYHRMALASSNIRVLCHALLNPKTTPAMMEQVYRTLDVNECPDSHVMAPDERTIKEEILRRLPLDRAHNLAGDDPDALTVAFTRHDQPFREADATIRDLEATSPAGPRPARHALIAHPQAPTSLIAAALENPHPLDWPDLATHAPAALLPLLARKITEATHPTLSLWDNYGDGWFETLTAWRRGLHRLILRQNELSEEALQHLTAPDQVDAHYLLATNPNTPHETLMTILQRGPILDDPVNSFPYPHVAAHPNFNWKTRIRNARTARKALSRHGLNPDNPRLLAGIACHPNTAPAFTDNLLRDAGPEIGEKIADVSRRGLHEPLRKHLLTHDNINYATIALTSAHTTMAELHDAATDPHPLIRELAARHHGAPTHILLLLEQDHDANVAEAAKWHRVDIQEYGRFRTQTDPLITLYDPEA